jgi:hypothetical protein
MRIPLLACLTATRVLATKLVTSTSDYPNLGVSLITPENNHSFSNVSALGRFVHPAAAAVDIDTVWYKASCTGEKLLHATSLTRNDPGLPALISPVVSP